MYNSIILPVLYYGILAWGNAYETHLQRVIVLQKRAIRIISHAPFLAHTGPLFKNLRVLKFKDMYDYQLAIFMFQCHKQVLPKSLCDLFMLNSNVHEYNTRNANRYHLPQARTSSFQRTIIYNGPSKWNSIPSEFCDLKFINTFKHKFKNYLLDLL